MKKKQSERLFSAFGDISDRYVDEALGKKTLRYVAWKKWIALAACFAVVVSLSLYLFIPITDAPDLSAYDGNPYYPLISKIENFYYKPHNKQNNFEKIVATLGNLLPSKKYDVMDDGNLMLPESSPPSSSVEDGYFEVTDNQVEGVIEGDLIKASETHLFRLSYSTRS